MDSVMKVMVDYYLIDAVIGMMGIFGIALIVERYKALFFTYSLEAKPFMAHVIKLVEDDKTEEAIAYCAANETKPLAYVIKRILERSDRDEGSMNDSLDIAASEIAPGLTKNLTYLAMVSNVVTLIGLLGTVVGLIMSFKAVAFADPSQKQTLLADGISMAMNATAAGLCVAIPVMVFYSFLHSKQGKLFAEIDLWANKTLDVLKNRGMENFVQASVYTGSETKKVKIPAPSKAA